MTHLIHINFDTESAAAKLRRMITVLEFGGSIQPSVLIAVEMAVELEKNLNLVDETV